MQAVRVFNDRAGKLDECAADARRQPERPTPPFPSLGAMKTPKQRCQVACFSRCEQTCRCSAGKMRDCHFIFARSSSHQFDPDHHSFSPVNYSLETRAAPIPEIRLRKENVMRPVLHGAFVAALIAAAGAHDASDVRRGEALLARNCARCHAIGSTGESRHPQAPLFRHLSTNYPIEFLEEALGEGIISGHPDMPEFAFDGDDVGAIIAYLKSIQER
jgi:cytochrome c